jgi:cytochrome c peroxidase
MRAWRRFCSAALLLLLGNTPFWAEAGEAYRWNLPPWVPVPVIPADNPMTSAKVELGRYLFFDRRLSRNQTQSCASCHDPKKAFTDGLAAPLGVTGERAPRSAMSLTNVAFLSVYTWANPQLTSLEVQALIPLFGEHPVEMGMGGREAELFARIKAEPRYRSLFGEAFPSEARQGDEALYSLSTLTKALASFQRSLLSFDSPYDRMKYGGQPRALSAAAKRGEQLFFGERLECYHCHGSFTFTDNIRHSKLPFPETGFHNTGLYNVDGVGGYPRHNPGIMELTGDPADVGRFRTPTLRNVSVTAPYMHDGSIATLREVIRSHYSRAGRASIQGKGPNPKRSELIAGFKISNAEVNDLIAFLASLTDSAFLSNSAHQDPWRAGK